MPMAGCHKPRGKYIVTGSFIGTPWLSSQATNGFVIFDNYLEAYTGSEEIVEIPPEVRVIGHNAFDSNAFVSTIIIPHGVTNIEEMAFANCRKLKMVQIPDSVSNIEDNAFENDSNLVIQCTRGSAASAFRIRNKIAGEYIAKAKLAEVSENTHIKKKHRSIGEGLSGLSDDELCVIMEMRRKKLAHEKEEKAKPVEPEKTDYVLVPFDKTKVSIKLQNDNRMIANNIFNLRFIQNEPVSSVKASSEYETFVVDSFGQVISDIKLISADNAGDDLTHKITYSLSAQKKFDKTSAYYIILRYRGAGTNILNKTQYQINIEFASDFNF